MENRIQDNRYEKLFLDMVENACVLHRRNKKRIRGAITLQLLSPFILMFIRWMTDSDKIVFLLVWVFCLFAICGYLIGIDYLDDRIRKTVAEITDGEMELDGLLQEPAELRAELEEMFRKRIEARAKVPDAVLQGSVEEAVNEEGGAE